MKKLIVTTEFTELTDTDCIIYEEFNQGVMFEIKHDNTRYKLKLTDITQLKFNKQAYIRTLSGSTTVIVHESDFRDKPRKSIKQEAEYYPDFSALFYLTMD